MPHVSPDNARTYNKHNLEESFPEGTVYTIYSLNLRYLFVIDNDKESLKEKIKVLRTKNMVITWLKSRYFQSEYRKLDLGKRNESGIVKKRIERVLADNRRNKRILGKKIIDQDHNLLFKWENEENFSGERINELVEIIDSDDCGLLRARRFAETLKKNPMTGSLDPGPQETLEALYRLPGSIPSENGKTSKKAEEWKFVLGYFTEAITRDKSGITADLGEISAAETVDHLFDRLLASERARKKEYAKSRINLQGELIHDSNDGEDSAADKIEQLTNIIALKSKDLSHVKNFFDSLRNAREASQKKGSAPKNSPLEDLKNLHKEVVGQEQKIHMDRIDEVRQAEIFLASDEFAKFAEDPFFIISKNMERTIDLDGESCVLEDVTDDEEKILQDGHEFSVFRGHLKEKWLNSLTYRIRSKNRNADYYIRLSRLGLLQIRKEQWLGGYYNGPIDDNEKSPDFCASLIQYQLAKNLTPSGILDPETLSSLNIDSAADPALQVPQAKETLKKKSLIQVLSSLLESQKRYTGDDEKKKISDILQVATGFAGLLEFRTTSNFDVFSGKIRALKAADAARNYEDLERQKYIVISLTKFESSSEEPVRFCDISHPEVISCLLQGSLDTIGERYSIPNTTGKANPEDLSTWNDELCVFSPERGLIYFKDRKTFEVGGREIDYQAYWKCIVRGIEYTVALRASLQLLETRTTRMLDNIPDILKAFHGNTDPDLKEKTTADETVSLAREKLRHLTTDLASVLRVLPALRSIAIPTNAFRSGHSVQKFSYLYQDCFNFDGTIKNILKNIDELTSFITFFEQQLLQLMLDKKAERQSRENTYLTILALTFTVTSILYVAPSFIHDFAGIEGGSSYITNGIYLYVAIFLLAIAAIAIWKYWRRD